MSNQRLTPSNLHQWKISLFSLICLTGLVTGEQAWARPGYADTVKRWCSAAKRPAPVFKADECSTCHDLGNYESQTAYKKAFSAKNLDVFCAPESINQPPRLIIEPSGVQTVVAGQPLKIKVSAQDPEGHGVILTAKTLPEGSNFDPTTGSFSWVPPSSAIGSHSLVIMATDQPSDPATANSVEQTITLQVTDTAATNTPPTLTPLVTPQTVNVSEKVVIPVEAIDAETDTLVLSANQLPEGARFRFIGLEQGKWRGELTWQPTVNQANQRYTVSFVARETDTVPLLQASQNLELIVKAAMTDGKIRKIVLDQVNYRRGQLNLAGQIKFRQDKVDARGLEVTLTDGFGQHLGQVFVNRKGKWALKIPMDAAEAIPCTVQAEVNGIVSEPVPVKPLTHSCLDDLNTDHTDHDDHDEDEREDDHDDHREPSKSRD